MKRLITVATAVMLLAGCSTTASPDAPPTSPSSATVDSGIHNDTDVMFLQMMVAQYAPAAQILELARSRTKNEQVRMLAAAIDVTQADESATMQGWLRGWQQPLAPDAQPELHAGHGGLPATGDAEVEALRATPDADFDRTFLNLLIGHQHQAIGYARMELTSGAHPRALDLAKRIDQSRTAQVEMMLKLAA